MFKVGKALQKMLEKIGYSVINTRSEISDAPSISNRNSLAKNSDYFISLHGDGACNAFISGALSEYQVYPNNIETQQNQEFAKDILSFYNIVKVAESSPFVDFERSQKYLGVLKPDNTAKRKTLIELGYTTSPNDYNRIELNLNLIAVQLAKGLEKNVIKYYKQKAYEVAGKVFYDKNEAEQEDLRIQKEIKSRTQSIISLQSFTSLASNVKEVETIIEPVKDSFYTEFLFTN